MRRHIAGQVTVEYFLLFAVVVLVTLIGLTTVDNDLATTFERLFATAADRIALESPSGGDDGGGDVNPPPNNQPPVGDDGGIDRPPGPVPL